MINFEDATGHDVVIPSNQYPGATLSNAVWITSDTRFFDGSAGLGVENGVFVGGHWGFPGTTIPIVIMFDTAVKGRPNTPVTSRRFGRLKTSLSAR